MYIHICIYICRIMWVSVSNAFVLSQELMRRLVIHVVQPLVLALVLLLITSVIRNPWVAVLHIFIFVYVVMIHIKRERETRISKVSTETNIHHRDSSWIYDNECMFAPAVASNSATNELSRNSDKSVSLNFDPTTELTTVLAAETDQCDRAECICAKDVLNGGGLEEKGDDQCCLEGRDIRASPLVIQAQLSLQSYHSDDGSLSEGDRSRPAYRGMFSLSSADDTNSDSMNEYANGDGADEFTYLDSQGEKVGLSSRRTSSGSMEERPATCSLLAHRPTSRRQQMFDLEAVQPGVIETTSAENGDDVAVSDSFANTAELIGGNFLDMSVSMKSADIDRDCRIRKFSFF